MLLTSERYNGEHTHYMIIVREMFDKAPSLARSLSANTLTHICFELDQFVIVGKPLLVRLLD